MAAKQATLFFLDGKTLDVAEAFATLTPMMVNGASLRYSTQLTKPTGEKVWVNLYHVCRIEPA